MLASSRVVLNHRNFQTVHTQIRTLRIKPGKGPLHNLYLRKKPKVSETPLSEFTFDDSDASYLPRKEIPAISSFKNAPSKFSTPKLKKSNQIKSTPIGPLTRKQRKKFPPDQNFLTDLGVPIDLQEAIHNEVGKHASSISQFLKSLVSKAKKELHTKSDKYKLEYTTDSTPESTVFYRSQLKSLRRDGGVVRPGMISTLFLMVEHLTKNPIAASKVSPDVMLSIQDLAEEFPKPFDFHKAYALGGKLIYMNKMRLDTVHENMYIDSLIAIGDCDRAIAIWKAGKPKGKSFGRWWYDLGFRALISGRRIDEAEELAEETFKRFHSMNPASVCGFIEAYCQLNKPEKAEKWFRYYMNLILTRGLTAHTDEKPTFPGDDMSHYFNYLNMDTLPTDRELLIILDKYLKIGDLSKINEISQILTSNEDLIDQGKLLVKNLDIFVKLQLIPRLNEAETSEDAKFLFQDLMRTYSDKHPQILKKAKFYHHMVSTLATYKQYESAIDLFRQMVEQNIKVDPVFFHTIIKLLLTGSPKKRKGMVTIAEGLLESLENSKSEQISSSSSDGIIPPVNTYHYALFIDYYGRKGDYSKVEEIVQKVGNQGLQMSAPFMNSYLKVLAMTKQYNKALTFLRAHWDQTPKKNNRLYNTIWKIHSSCFRAKNKAHVDSNLPYDLRDLYVMMVLDKDLSPDSLVMKAVVKSFCYCGDFIGAIAVLQHMGTKLDLQPTVGLIVFIQQLVQRGGISNLKLHEEVQNNINDYCDHLIKRHEELKELANEMRMVREIEGVPLKVKIRRIQRPSYFPVGDWKVPATQLLMCMRVSQKFNKEIDEELAKAQKYFSLERIPVSAIAESVEDDK